MRVLLAGANGALGIRLTRRLIDQGHEVLGLTRSPLATHSLVELGAIPVVVDALDRDGVLRAVDGLAADAVINELTALKKAPARHRGMAMTDRLRIDGTRNLVLAANAMGATRFVTQSIVFGYGYRDHGSRVLDEHAPFGQLSGDKTDQHVFAMLSTEQQAFGGVREGIALRYGLLYGGELEATAALLMKRRIPVTASEGLLGWVHHDDAVAATVAALECGHAGHAYNIVDDHPVSWRTMFTETARAVGAPSPHQLPPWMFRAVAPYVATFAVDTSMRVTNAKAKQHLRWNPAYPSYREGVDAMRDRGRV